MCRFPPDIACQVWRGSRSIATVGTKLGHLDQIAPQAVASSADGGGMTVQGMATCAHCGALLTTPVCAICGKSVRDEVEVVDAVPASRGMSPEGRRQVMGFVVFLGVVAGLALGGLWFFSRESVEPIPAALATPDPTQTTTTTEAPVAVDPPTIARPDAAAEPLPTIAVTVGDVGTGDGSNPWAGTPPRNVVSGDLLDNTDYDPGIAAVATLLAAAPTNFIFDAPTLTEWNGIDLTAAETAQPFAARSIADDTGAIADVWVFARGASTSDGSAAFLDQALLAWPVLEPIESYSPRPGVRLHRISDDGAEAVWVDARSTWMLIYRTPSGTDAGLLGAVSEDWG